MYIPKHFEQNDNKKSIAFMQTYNFALIVSVKDEKPIATHLPFVTEEKDNIIILTSHLSKANEQWKTFEDKEVLVVFSEPHAYISPALYDTKQNVPTWNYIAVHAYGKIKILNSVEEKLMVLYKQMQTFESDYIEQFKNLDNKYINDLLNGIVAFEIIVSDLQSKEKLSQNKTANERNNIKQHLMESDETVKKNLGKQM